MNEASRRLWGVRKTLTATGLHPSVRAMKSTSVRSMSVMTMMPDKTRRVSSREGNTRGVANTHLRQEMQRQIVVRIPENGLLNQQNVASGLLDFLA
jgi:hypothetical protein